MVPVTWRLHIMWGVCVRRMRLFIPARGEDRFKKNL